MKTRVFHTQFWEDEYVCELTSTERMVFAYLLLNSKVNICGVYEIPVPKISFDTALDREDIKDALTKLERDGKIKRHKAWVRVINISKYNSYKGPKNEEALKKELRRCPRDLLEESEIILLDTSIDTTIYTVPIGTRNQNTEIRNQKPIQRKVFPERWRYDSDEDYNQALLDYKKY